MALADTAKLLASLELKDQFSPTVAKALGGLGKLETRFGKIGSLAQQGVGNAVRNIERLGVVAVGALGLAVKGGLSSLAQVESGIVAADAAIKQVGLTGKVTGAQIATWANNIESAIGAAFDDKAILAATTTLIRFGKVTSSNLRPAMQIIADLATKTGDVDSAATLLAKALADPAKAAGKLARSGVVLTKTQQDQVKAFVKAGKAAQAQKIILDSLAATTKGAAAASQGPYARALSVLRDVTEDAQKALATGFLPVIEKVADLLGKELAKPQTLANIKQFGQSLASGLDKLIELARRLPWGTIGDSLKLAGSGARAVLDAFLALPDWVKTAVITGWGLNKLTGGALGGIVGELAKGLIKGVLGINAGVVNINAASVAGAGGVGAVTRGGGLLQSVKVIGSVIVAGIALDLLYNAFMELSAKVGTWATDLNVKIDKAAGMSGAASITAVRNLTAATKALLADMVSGVLLQTGTGRDELVRSFKTLAQNIAGDKTLSAADRRLATLELGKLEDAIVAAFPTRDERTAARSQLDGILTAARDTTTATSQTKQAIHDTAAYAAFQADTWGNRYLAKLDAIRKATEANKPPPPLVPTKLGFGGEPRVLQSSAAILELMGLKPGDLQATAKILRDVAVLEKTSTQSRAKLVPALADMGGLLTTALKQDNLALAATIAGAIAKIEARTGIHAPKADVAQLALFRTLTTTVSGVMTKIGTALDELGHLRIPAPRVNVRFGNPINRTTVNVTIGARSVIRSISSGGGYGPAFVFGGGVGTLYEGPN